MFARRMRRFTVLLAFSLVLPACGSHGASPTPTGTHATVSRSSAPASSALGVHWPGADLPAGAVLYDNGGRLTAYSLNGTSTVVWVHRRVQVSAIAASLNGHELAYIVGGSRQQLLDLRPDGSVSVVGTGSMWEPPSFLRPPSQPHAPVRLFYTTQSESVGSGALMMQTAGGAERVAVNLRGGEAPLMVTGYPGGSGAALTLVRRIQPPMVEFVLDEDRGSPTPTWSIQLATTQSKAPSGSGRQRASATAASRPAARARATIAGAESIAVTVAPVAATRSANSPVPAPTSSTCDGLTSATASRATPAALE